MSTVRVFALGGLDESGKNLTVIEVDGSMLIVEAGLKYPEEDQLGVEYIIPDFSYLVEHQNRVKGIIITHAHDDVMAALPHLLKQIPAPIYTTALTAEFINRMIQEEDIRNVKIHRIKRNQEFKISGITVRTFMMSHSIAESFGIAVETPMGYIVYTSEFIIDFDAKDGFFGCDLTDLADIGKKGVLCLLAESGGAERQGYTAPYHKITSKILPVLEEAAGRVIITAYTQNLYRIIGIIEAANRLNKRIYFFEDELKEMIRVVERLGIYRVPMGLELPKSTYRDDMDDIIVLMTGNGRHVFRTMNKIAMQEDSRLQLRNTDTVIIASPIVPGTEIDAGILENELYKMDLNIVTLNPKEVLSMHASSEDLKMMLYLFKPQYYIPVKGEYRQLIANADIATTMGLRPDRIVILDNGQIAEFEDGRLKSCSEQIEVSEVLIDGNENLDSAGYVLKDREMLSTDGVIVIGIVCNYQTKEIIAGPDVQSRGVFYLKDADYIVKTIADIIMDVINTNVANGTYDNKLAREEAREKISRYVLKETGKRPMILPGIIEIMVSAD
ncbi:MAG: ribonuclease J [Erysipelotrichaceae bacterium]|nr:ribonuclease J [Erysipelotrichaceae bacterium]